MFNDLYVLLGDAFFKAQNKEDGNHWFIINLSVPVILLYDLYNRMIAEGQAPIESLSVELKLKYLTIASKYYDEPEQQIKASKAAFMLSLITSTD